MGAIMLEFRCNGTMHARLLDENTIEFKCKRRACGHRPGVVAIHEFNIHTGELIATRQFANPRKEQVTYGSGEPGSAIRSA